MVNYLIELEQKNYPYYDVIGIDIISNVNGVIKYSVLIASKLDSKWQKWETTQKINISEIISEVRDRKIESLLSSDSSLSQK